MFLQILVPICAPAIFNLLLSYDLLSIFIDMSRIQMGKASKNSLRIFERTELKQYGFEVF